jgi:diguanylate cyclase (GGDEF)-like protein
MPHDLLTSRRAPTFEVGAELRPQPVPRRALAISFAALALPVAAALWLPEQADNSLGTLTWLTALIPAFLLAYYRGFAGVTIALAGGMAVITATQISIVVFDITEPNWPLLAAIVGAYLVVSLGIGVLAEVLRRERRAAESMALIDRLTGLPNRRYADLTLEREFAAAARGGVLTVVIFDLDLFKSVNDRFGHTAGDGVLRAFGRVLQENTRKANLSARFGGEEFISILRDSTAEAGAIAAKRVLDQTRDLHFPWGKQTVSAGIATYEPGMGSYELLVGAADRALYMAKEGGRDRACIAQPFGARSDVAPSSAAGVAPSSAAGVAPGVPATAGVVQPTRAPKPAVGVPKVYVVDDDAQVLSAVKRMLHGRGFEVWGTTDPAEAIRTFTNARPEDRPALIIADLIMPDMTGTRMMEQIERVSPGIPVIYMSGYVHERASWTGMPGSVAAILEKPIAPEKLREVAERTLAAAPVTPTAATTVR